MKKLLTLALSTVCLAGLADPTVSDLIVRQNWPWNAKITADFLLSGVDSCADLTFHAYDGAEDLGVIPVAALTPSARAQKGDGVRHFEIDPALCAFAGRGRLDNFRLTVTATASISDEVLYRIVDLKTFASADVTRGDILDGKYGTYETDPSWIQAKVKENHTHPILFVTGFTNDTTYATDKLVLRRIPAGTYTVGDTSCPSATDGTFRHTVTLSDDYWIGIFELTQKQWYNVYGMTITCTYTGDCRPVQSNVSYDMIRGFADTGSAAAYNWPSGRDVRTSSFMGTLRTKTGLNFDLPTRAEWLVAASAGAYDARCYDGSTPANSTKSESAWFLGRNAQNAATTGYPLNGTANVGRYRANAYGLYDTLGNVQELVLDWYGEALVRDRAYTDPEGPTSGTMRMKCGGAYTQSQQNGSLLTNRSGIAPGNGDAGLGFRVAIRPN